MSPSGLSPRGQSTTPVLMSVSTEETSRQAPIKVSRSDLLDATPAGAGVTPVVPRATPAAKRLPCIKTVLRLVLHMISDLNRPLTLARGHDKGRVRTRRRA